MREQASRRGEGLGTRCESRPVVGEEGLGTRGERRPLGGARD